MTAFLLGLLGLLGLRVCWSAGLVSASRRLDFWVFARLRRNETRADSTRLDPKAKAHSPVLEAPQHQHHTNSIGTNPQTVPSVAINISALSSLIQPIHLSILSFHL
jgi:hypothetical protein